MAFDILHRIRNKNPLSNSQIKTLSAFLDFGACVNATLDDKVYCPHELQRTRHVLKEDGFSSLLTEYLQRLNSIERRRPSPRRDRWQFHNVGLYREAVVRLSLGMVAVITDVYSNLDAGIKATYDDVDINLLFRIVMQCQIVDDVLDYSKDKAAGLPSFLNSSSSLALAIELTALAIVQYATHRDVPRSEEILLLRLTLWLISVFAKVVILVGCRGFSSRSAMSRRPVTN